MNDAFQFLKIDVFGIQVTSMELAYMTHLSQTTVYRWLKRYGFYDGNNAAAERFLLDHGLSDRDKVQRRLNKIKLEHPDYYKPRAYGPIIRFGPATEPRKEKKRERLTYTQELKALGFEPWPSDYDLEARGER